MHMTTAYPQPLAATVTAASATSVSPELIEFVDFKWLMAGEGHRIDLDRLRTEPAYTRGCLALAGGSTSATLRRAGSRLARALGCPASSRD